MGNKERYEGAVVFVNGVHYVVGDDGHADLERPLRRSSEGGWRPAGEDEPLHNDVNHVQDAGLEIGGES